jgi:hypothetical protein
MILLKCQRTDLRRPSFAFKQLFWFVVRSDRSVRYLRPLLYLVLYLQANFERHHRLYGAYIEEALAYKFTQLN